MSSLEIKIKSTAKLSPHPKNARLHDEVNLQTIMTSLEEFGQRTPIVVWKKGLVIKGCGTLEAMKRLGWKKCEVVSASHLSEEKALQYSIIDNQAGDLSEFDEARLHDILSDIVTDGNLEDVSRKVGFAPSTVTALMEYTDDEEEAPDDFDSYDEDIDTSHECPKCGYEWS